MNCMSMKKIAALLSCCLFLAAPALYAASGKAAALTSLAGRTFIVDTFSIGQTEYYNWEYVIGKSDSLLTIYTWNEKTNSYDSKDYEYKITDNKIKYGKGLSASKGTIQSKDRITFKVLNVSRSWKATDGSVPLAGSKIQYWKCKFTSYIVKQEIVEIPMTRYGGSKAYHIEYDNKGYARSSGGGSYPDEHYVKKEVVDRRYDFNTPFYLYLDGKCIFEGTAETTVVKLSWGKEYEVEWWSPSSQAWESGWITNNGKSELSINLN